MHLVIIDFVLYVLTKELTKCSAAAFDAEYGLLGFNGDVSLKEF